MTQKIQQSLLQWFYKNQRSMPWRENPTPYRVWISEIMLQQTTVATVHSYFIRFMDKFPTLDHLSRANEDDILKLWAGLGYYSRARNILKTARILQSEENFPQTYQELLQLPGIGPYTAGAIASIAFHQPVSLVDTNVDRVIGRFYALNRKTEDFEKQLRSFAQKNIEQVNPTEIWAWNQAIMELGALCCKPKVANCEDCPLQSGCQAFSSKQPLNFPGDKIKIPKIHKTEYALLIQKDNQFLLQKITKGTQRKGLYDFIITDKFQGDIIKTINYSISNSKVTRHMCLSHYSQHSLDSTMIWLSLDEALNNYPLVSPCKKVLKLL